MNLRPKGIIGTVKEPLKWWECGDPHIRIKFPLFNQSNKVVHNLLEASIVGEVGRSFHQINAALENRQASHQYGIVEIEGTIYNQNLDILIDQGATLSYITPKVAENCQLAREGMWNPGQFN